MLGNHADHFMLAQMRERVTAITPNAGGRSLELPDRERAGTAHIRVRGGMRPPGPQRTVSSGFVPGMGGDMMPGMGGEMMPGMGCASPEAIRRAGMGGDMMPGMGQTDMLPGMGALDIKTAGLMAGLGLGLFLWFRKR